MFAASKTAGAVSAEVNYIESVFSCFLYTGNGTSQTITNGIDLAGEGGLVWLKCRSSAQSHGLFDTNRGENPFLSTNSAIAQFDAGNGVVYNSNGFTNKATSYFGGSEGSGLTYASWTFRKQPKFFDVVTWTGNGANRTIAHNLGSVPGCIIVKRTDGLYNNWQVYHRSIGNTQYMTLNSTNEQLTDADGARWNSTTPTSTVFSVGIDASVNVSGGTYVAYLFAHNAGGFGLTGTDNVISCGSYTGTGSAGNVVTLGFEPQWLLIKPATVAGYDWLLIDNMRGMPVSGAGAVLNPNAAYSESTLNPSFAPSATGFVVNRTDASSNGSGETYIYIAIRRGPMKVPTSGTSVFAPSIGNNSTSAGGEIFTSGFPVDFFMRKVRATTDFAPSAYSRLTAGKYLVTGTTAAEATDTSTWFDTNTGIDYQYASNFSGQIGWLFQRAPSFFDVVCYTGTGSARTINHNLGVAPELMIVKIRSGSQNWMVYSSALGAANALILNVTDPVSAIGSFLWNSTSPTASVFTLGTSASVNNSGSTYVAYLFATCAGVSKVGSYTGTGATQTISCGLAARFVLIKRTDSTGNWFVWDTARGMVAGTDPRLALNSTAAESNANWVYTDASGFQIVTTDASVNASGGTYIYLAIA